MNKFYTQSKTKRTGDENEGASDIEAIEEIITSRAPYEYSFREFTMTRLMKLLCCCCRGKDFYKQRVSRLKSSEKVTEALNEQIDIVEIIKQIRIFTFLSMVNMKRSQTELVQYFSNFCLKVKEGTPKLR